MKFAPKNRILTVLFFLVVAIGYSAPPAGGPPPPSPPPPPGTPIDNYLFILGIVSMIFGYVSIKRYRINNTY